jgi:hypothetical protein
MSNMITIHSVMPGLVPGIHVFAGLQNSKTWMAPELGLARVLRFILAQVGYTRLALTSPAMTMAPV